MGLATAVVGGPKVAFCASLVAFQAIAAHLMRANRVQAVLHAEDGAGHSGSGRAQNARAYLPAHAAICQDARRHARGHPAVLVHLPHPPAAQGERCSLLALEFPVLAGEITRHVAVM